MEPQDLLNHWVERDATGDTDWFQAQRDELSRTDDPAKLLFRTIGLVPRKLGKADLRLSTDDLAAANAAVEGWDPTGFSVDMAARLALILTAHDGSEQFLRTFDTLWRTADIGEQVAFYRGLPLFPKPETLLWRATDGCRTNIKGVFEAIAHRNPYPARHFDEVAFNQLCLKALFVGSHLHLIHGLIGRLNQRLSRMMTDYAYERWAASRVVSPELWLCVASHPDDRCMEALERALSQTDELTRNAAALACSQSDHPEVLALLRKYPPLAELAQSGTLSWQEMAEAFES